jgi:BirA family biotin operon repressor/biotin-[acetyl-CoA-carboxylase] ligase
VILGIGLNANFPVNDLPEDVRGTATTLQKEGGKDISIEGLFKTLIMKLDDIYDKLLSGQSGFILEMWRDRSDTLGQYVRVTTLKENIEGTAVDIDESGALMVRTENGEMRNIIAGDCVHLVRKQ